MECGDESHVAASSSPGPPPLPPSRASSRGNRGRAAAGSREVQRSEAENGAGERRSASTGGGAGRAGMESGDGMGRQLEAAEAPRDPGGGGQRAACAPAGSRRGPCGPAPPSGPRRRSILFLLGGRGPGVRGLLFLPPVSRFCRQPAGGVGRPQHPTPPGLGLMCIYELD